MKKKTARSKTKKKPAAKAAARPRKATKPRKVREPENVTQRAATAPKDDDYYDSPFDTVGGGDDSGLDDGIVEE